MWIGNGWCGWTARGMSMYLGDSGVMRARDGVVIVRFLEWVRRMRWGVRRPLGVSSSLRDILVVDWEQGGEYKRTWTSAKGERWLR